MKEILQKLERGEISAEQAEEQLNPEYSWLKAIWYTFVAVSCVWFLVFWIGFFITGASFDTVFTNDYVKLKRNQLDIRIESYKDSCLKYNDEPEQFNRYKDSANKYIAIYNYLHTPHR